MTDSPGRLPIDAMRGELDAGLHRTIDRLRGSQNGLWEMASYAMGWSGEGSNPETTGKRIRPLLCLLVCGACGGDWRKALPPACAVELIHSFSLIHDDIQDASIIRRGRPSVWKRYGSAQAINVGDAIFTLAFTALADSDAAHSFEWLRVLSDTNLQLTYGQYLDLAYEDAQGITLAQYQEMIGGKTAALVEGACRLGAISADASEARRNSFGQFGRALGLAFQIQDDYLGVWGDPQITGKPNASDILGRKKSLPILYGLEYSEKFRTLLTAELTAATLPTLLTELELCGAKQRVLSDAREWTGRAFDALRAGEPHGEFGPELETFARALFGRQK
jgi:geranylgeranyl diphosphate synthase type I